MSRTHTVIVDGVTDTRPVDLDDWPYIDDESLGPWRLTKCCHASAKGTEWGICCRHCYEEVPWDVDCPARLDANWSPGDGPVRITLE